MQSLITDREFMGMLKDKWGAKKFVSVGLDSDDEKLPDGFSKAIPFDVEEMLRFNCSVVDATKAIACIYKPNWGFYAKHGDKGMAILKKTIDYILENSDAPVSVDFKAGDIGNTNIGYIKQAFEYLRADSVTINPYFGQEAMKQFLAQKDKGIIVVAKTSNPGGGEFQNLLVFPDTENENVKVPEDEQGIPLYQYVALRVSRYWNTNGNCLVVAGATYPKETAKIREVIGDEMPILMPGVGNQGADLEQAILAGRNSRGEGFIVNSSSGITFASKESDFALAAEKETIKLNDNINKYRLM